jgi:phosphoribosylformylglycinamidine synthase
MKLEARWQPCSEKEPDFPQPADMGAALCAMLGRLNICSKESVVRRYDHEVKAGTVIKPLLGRENDGPSDAAVIRPLADSFEGVVVAHGICPRYSDIDSYHMMVNAVDEALRNYVAVGGDLEHVAGLDNFCWCDPVQSDKNPDGAHKAAQLVRTNKALYDSCVAFEVPLISGKDSMKNDYQIGATKISIPPTVLFSVIGKIPDVRRAVSMDVKQPGDAVYLLGRTRPELGGSEYYDLHGFLGRSVPEVEPLYARHLFTLLNRAQQEGLVASCHDLSDGGLGVALAESAFAGGLGLDIELAQLTAVTPMRDDFLLFSETPSRFLVTVHQENHRRFESLFSRSDFSRIGTVLDSDHVIIKGQDENIFVRSDIHTLKQAWQAPLRGL